MFPICKKLNNFCLYDGKNIFLEKKFTSIKCTFKQRVFFRPNRGDGGGTFRLYFWNLLKIWL